eukprot:2029877-Rhodomonas_salina.3
MKGVFDVAASDSALRASVHSPLNLRFGVNGNYSLVLATSSISTISGIFAARRAVSYTHLRAHETEADL